MCNWCEFILTFFVERSSLWLLFILMWFVIIVVNRFSLFMCVFMAVFKPVLIGWYQKNSCNWKKNKRNPFQSFPAPLNGNVISSIDSLFDKMHSHRKIVQFRICVLYTICQAFDFNELSTRFYTPIKLNCWIKLQT